MNILEIIGALAVFIVVGLAVAHACGVVEFSAGLDK